MTWNNYLRRTGLALGLVASLAFSGQKELISSSAGDSSKITSGYINSIQHFKNRAGQPIFTDSNEIYNAYIVGIDSAFLDVLYTRNKSSKYPWLAGFDSSSIKENKSVFRQEYLVDLRIFHHYFYDDCSKTEIKHMVSNLKNRNKHDPILYTSGWNELINRMK